MSLTSNYPQTTTGAEDNEASGKFYGTSVQDEILKWREHSIMQQLDRYFPTNMIIPHLIKRQGDNFDPRENNMITDDQATMNSITAPLTLNEQRQLLLLGEGGLKNALALQAIEKTNNEKIVDNLSGDQGLNFSQGLNNLLDLSQVPGFDIPHPDDLLRHKRAN